MPFVKLHSVIDIITNSSSEIFVFTPESVPTGWNGDEPIVCLETEHQKSTFITRYKFDLDLEEFTALYELFNIEIDSVWLDNLLKHNWEDFLEKFLEDFENHTIYYIHSEAYPYFETPHVKIWV